MRENTTPIQDDMQLEDWDDDESEIKVQVPAEAQQKYKKKLELMKSHYGQGPDGPQTVVQDKKELKQMDRLEQPQTPKHVSKTEAKRARGEHVDSEEEREELLQD